jgi:hypothetical protein
MTFLVDDSMSGNLVISQESYIMMMVEPILDPSSFRRVASAGDVRSLTMSLPPIRRRKSESDAHPARKRRRVRIQVEPLQVVEGEELPDNKTTCWYSKEDLVVSRRIARKLSRQVNSDPVLMETYYIACEPVSDDSVPSCWQSPPQRNDTTTAAAVKILKHSSAFWKQRGLERLSKGHSLSRSIQVCSVKSAVLLEQSSQYLEGIQDPERLAHASLMASRPSQQFAHFLAMADQAMAERIHQEKPVAALTA